MILACNAENYSFGAWRPPFLLTVIGHWIRAIVDAHVASWGKLLSRNQFGIPASAIKATAMDAKLSPKNEGRAMRQW
jgi:hypothetical protein